MFTNNIIVRFHPSLEMVGDEVKTIVCRYPEPVVPPPLGPPLPISVANAPVDPVPQRLAEPQILMIICALLFLAMMLFGVACSYFCLKQRNIHLIRRRRVLSSGFGSEITGVSEQTLFPPFAGLKIPRAHAPSSGSDQQPIVESSETLPSDYPSESRSGSEIEEGDARSFRQPSSIESIQQREEVPVQHSYEPELSSVYSDAHNCQDFDEFNLPTAIPRVDPTFDVAFRVKSPPRRSPAPSSVTSEETVASTANVLLAQERALTTILEREEWRQTETMSAVTGQPTECPPLNCPPDAKSPPAPGYAELKRKPRSVLSARSIPENDVWSVTETEDTPDGRLRSPSPARSLESQARSVAETIVKHSKPFVPKPEATFRVKTDVPQVNEHTLVINEDIQLHTSIERQLKEDEETETMIVPTPERPIPPPKLTTQEVDDLYVQNVNERKVVDEEERIRRNTTEQYNRKRPAPLPPNWDVAIRTHPPAPHPPRSPSATTVSTMPDWNVQIRQYPPAYEPRTPSESTVWDEPPPEFDVKIRQYPPAYEPRSPSESTVWDEPEPRPDFDVKIRQYPPIYQPRSPSESTVWDDPEPQPQPDFDVKIRQYPPVYQPRSPSESTVWDDRSTVPEPRPDFDIKIRQYPPVYEPRSPSESTVWDDRSSVPESHPPPDFNVKIRQYPPVYEPRSPSESTVWDDRSTVPDPRPDFNVNIRQYPPVYEPRSPSESTVWDDRSSVPESRHPPPDFDVKVRQYPPIYEPREPSESTVWSHPEEEDRPEFDVKIRQYPPRRPSRSPSESTVQSEPPPNWDVLIRVLNPPLDDTPDDDDDVSSVLTVEDRQKWHRMITTESSLRTVLTEAVVHEDWERIRRDTRFQRIYEPKKWDVIIRILSAPVYPREDSSSDSRSSSERPRRSSRSRSSSLAPVNEIEPSYQPQRRDSDDWSHSSARTGSVYPRSTADRSMYSEMVDHPHRRAPEDWERYSDEVSRRSLARSTTEITEHWQRLPYDRVSNASENYSSSSRPRRRPILERSTTEIMEEVPHLEQRSSVSSGSDSSREFARRSRVPYERVSSSGSESGSHRQ